ncbi:MAG: NADH-quinone oxidoreductase subunit NuoK [Armatimonadetes bacterium CG_4_10_14_3_um_filter_66_18]|nr:MAG: NADH-quinone oxidoreductase subunit NuoK [Armatimonadetes bacterium CG06_land_8_20_14_3_00_66_21]PIX40092.1 MAG: NADH-quinone oxidoreductase subunit NuoK [Armatimonadetes bacterium CG_4_8_14_3_um_filter_66_20]PIY40069.1 MAG: NADH-quinone oxidoreductase subunit NuoK [Armatimonadetes bacterium CG_4_10_14_3_um_filter_66_18]PIZ37574.1 MAG: NADH-quinone oxidoreductase subunit NuoK [Armatimonadetes bacterium CG_4_10_14_0_8_um_filter_66_14]
MEAIGLNHYLVLSAILFGIGLYGVAARRNAIGVLMSIELMLNAVNINMVAFSRFCAPDQLHGQVFTIFVITVAAAEAAVGLALVISMYRNLNKINFDEVNLLKW